MSNIWELEDGNFAMEYAGGQTLVSASRESLERLGQDYDLSLARRARFLAAWQAGVDVAGQRFFDIKSETVASAQDKEELRPKWDYVEDNVGVLSHGERSFLIAMCGFFNDEWGAELSARFNETGSPVELAQILSIERRQIIADLLVNYQGW